jgi:hypothetical protein
LPLGLDYVVASGQWVVFVVDVDAVRRKQEDLWGDSLHVTLKTVLKSKHKVQQVLGVGLGKLGHVDDDRDAFAVDGRDFGGIVKTIWVNGVDLGVTRAIR